MSMDRLKQQLKRHEGYTDYPYQDTVGIWTAGYGHNLESHGEAIQSVTLEQAEQWLDEDIAHAIQIARMIFPTFDTLSEARREVLVNMAFNLGNRLAQFHGLQRAVASEEWESARNSMLASKWARQVKGRAVELAEQMENETIKEA